jgi:hypothetical protein
MIYDVLSVISYAIVDFLIRSQLAMIIYSTAFANKGNILYIIVVIFACTLNTLMVCPACCCVVHASCSNKYCSEYDVFYALPECPVYMG